MDVGTLDAADLDALSITTIRTLCIDAVQQADSGHPRGGRLSTGI